MPMIISLEKFCIYGALALALGNMVHSRCGYGVYYPSGPNFLRNFLSVDYWSKIWMSNFGQFWRFYRTEIEKISVDNYMDGLYNFGTVMNGHILKFLTCLKGVIHVIAATFCLNYCKFVCVCLFVSLFRQNGHLAHC